MELSGR